MIAAGEKDEKNQEILERKIMLESEKKIASNFLTVWDFEGYLKYSPLFYGWDQIPGIFRLLQLCQSINISSYYSKSSVGWGYQLPIAYFLAGLIVYIYSFFATLRK